MATRGAQPAARRGGRPPARSAGAVVVRPVAGELRYLVLRAYRHWGFPKGLIEPGETQLACARREVAEETGLSDLEFAWGEQFIDTEPYGYGKVARFYLARSASGEVRLGVNPALGYPEHHEYRWLPYAAARALLVPRLQTVLDWAQVRATLKNES